MMGSTRSAAAGRLPILVCARRIRRIGAVPHPPSRMASEYENRKSVDFLREALLRNLLAHKGLVPTEGSRQPNAKA